MHVGMEPHLDTIKLVTQKRMSGILAMDPDLVCAASVWSACNEGCPSQVGDVI